MYLYVCELFMNVCRCGCCAAAATCRSANSDKPFLKTLLHFTLHSHCVYAPRVPFIISCNRCALLLLHYYCITMCMCVRTHTFFALLSRKLLLSPHILFLSMSSVVSVIALFLFLLSRLRYFKCILQQIFAGCA